VKKKKNYLGVAIAIFLMILLWSCSGHRKPPVETPNIPVQKPAAEQTTQEIKPPEEVPAVEEEIKGEPLEEQDVEELPLEEESYPEEQVEPSQLLEEAFDAYQDARLAWDRGDLETALVALDEAYSILLKLDLPLDSPLIQEKNDLRLLIARRIQEIHASRFIVPPRGTRLDADDRKLVQSHSLLPRSGFGFMAIHLFDRSSIRPEKRPLDR